MKVPTKELIAVACAAYRKHGFMPVGSDVTSSEIIQRHFTGTQTLNVTEQDRENANDLIDHIQGLVLKAIQRNLSAYEQNALRLAQSDEADIWRSAQQAASLPRMLRSRKTNDFWDQREAELNKTSEWLGKGFPNVWRGSVLIEEMRYIEKSGRWLYLCSHRGANIVMFFSRKKKWNKGDIADIYGRIKKHKTNRVGGKVTHLNYVTPQDEDMELP
jgi:hypothetical protein